jgi:hypothetical protein
LIESRLVPILLSLKLGPRSASASENNWATPWLNEPYNADIQPNQNTITSKVGINVSRLESQHYHHPPIKSQYVYLDF